MMLILSGPIESLSKVTVEEWNPSHTSDFLFQRDIKWHFNPPASYHFGGIWWRLVRSCKDDLKVVLHGQVVTDKILETAFVETETLVNIRLLTEVSSRSGLEAIIRIISLFLVLI